MLIYRILSALVGIPMILFSVWYGGWPLTAVVLIIVATGIFEMSRLWKKMNINSSMPGALIGGALFVISAHAGGSAYLGAVLFLLLILSVIYLILVYPSFKLADSAATVFSSLYVGWLLTHIILLRQLPEGFHFVLLALVTTWSTDTFAYFVGIKLGRHKLAPVLSPKKSIEGSIGGVTGSIIAAVIIGSLNSQASIVHYISIGFLVGTIGQAGDLIESAIKRLAGVKDSGAIIPGHGGVLDRFDSLFLTAPLLYYYLIIIL